MFQDIDEYYNAMRMRQLMRAKGYVLCDTIERRHIYTIRRIALMCDGSRLLLVHSETQLVEIQDALRDIHDHVAMGRSIAKPGDRGRIWDAMEVESHNALDMAESPTGVTSADTINENTCVQVINIGTFSLSLEEMGRRMMKLEDSPANMHRVHSAIGLMKSHEAYNSSCGIDGEDAAEVVAAKAVAVICAVSKDNPNHLTLRFPHQTTLSSPFFPRDSEWGVASFKRDHIVDEVGLALATKLQEEVVKPDC